MCDTQGEVIAEFANSMSKSRCPDCGGVCEGWHAGGPWGSWVEQCTDCGRMFK